MGAFAVRKVIEERVSAIVKNHIATKEQLLEMFTELALDPHQNPFVRIKAGEVLLKVKELEPPKKEKMNGWILVEPEDE